MDTLLKDMISSMTEGRIRLRSPYLRDQNLAHRLAELAVGIEGVLDVTVNPLVGSALLLYDPKVVSTQKLLEHAKKLAVLFPTQPSPSGKKKHRLPVNG